MYLLVHADAYAYAGAVEVGVASGEGRMREDPRRGYQVVAQWVVSRTRT